ncbi:tRNA-dihydrouridine(20/20a) synthase [Alphaproteobacteria bacterium SO-S41]|nr:tRNA-dihydrouridine(20/20a) synthase [Alphaproteobacteria bacterium SO-S41]
MEKSEDLKPYRFSVAPMMDWTDRHCRMFHRILTRRALLYTEMVTTGALIHGPRDRLLAFSPPEHPVALQLGGSDPADLATCARMAEERGYDEVNLNCGCPSDRVQNGRFGACLMAEPALVADCIAAMKAAVKIPVTVKCRIGIDEQDPEQSLRTFIDTVAKAGPEVFIVHARKAWLKGLSPKENRDIPPLDYDLVRRVKAERPGLTIVLNGGVRSLEEASDHLAWADGVMMGRAAYEHPWMMARTDSVLFGAEDPVTVPEEAIRLFLPYVETELAAGTPLAAMTRHILGLFAGRPGARLFRRHLSENAHKRGLGIDVLTDALGKIGAPLTEAA